MASEVAKVFKLDHEITPIDVGATNVGIVVHSFNRNRKSIFKFVEKHTRNINERHFYTDKYHILEFSALNVPRLYCVNQVTPQKWMILTEMIEGAMRRPKLCTAAAAVLGTYLAEVALLEIADLQPHRLARRLTVEDVETAEQACQTEDERALCRSITQFLPKIEEKLSKLPDATCHNDLNWNNMAVPGDDFLTCPYIFDWERISRGCVGADLHFFAIEMSIEEPSSVGQALFKGFADRLNEAGLSEKKPLQSNALILSALSHGLAVRAAWVRKYDRIKHAPVTARAATRLAKHVQALAYNGELD